jgi:hypothetical protein
METNKEQPTYNAPKMAELPSGFLDIVPSVVPLVPLQTRYNLALASKELHGAIGSQSYGRINYEYFVKLFGSLVGYLDKRFTFTMCGKVKNLRFIWEITPNHVRNPSQIMIGVFLGPHNNYLTNIVRVATNASFFDVVKRAFTQPPIAEHAHEILSGLRKIESTHVVESMPVFQEWCKFIKENSKR